MPFITSVLIYFRVWLELRSVFDRLSVDPSVRAVVFSGSDEKAFSVGIDLKWVAKEGSPFNPRPDEYVDPARRAAALRRFGIEFQDCITSIEKCEKRMHPFPALPSIRSLLPVEKKSTQLQVFR